MLAKDRDARFATAREVADELAACERELSAAVLDAPAAAVPEEIEETARLLAADAAAHAETDAAGGVEHADAGHAGGCARRRRGCRPLRGRVAARRRR